MKLEVQIAQQGRPQKKDKMANHFFMPLDD